MYIVCKENVCAPHCIHESYPAVTMATFTNIYNANAVNRTKSKHSHSNKVSTNINCSTASAGRRVSVGRSKRTSNASRPNVIKL